MRRPPELCHCGAFGRKQPVLTSESERALPALFVAGWRVEGLAGAEYLTWTVPAPCHNARTAHCEGSELGKSWELFPTCQALAYRDGHDVAAGRRQRRSGRWSSQD